MPAALAMVTAFNILSAHCRTLNVKKLSKCCQKPIPQSLSLVVQIGNGSLDIFDIFGAYLCSML